MHDLSIDVTQQARRGGRAVGAVFFALFGGVWALLGSNLAGWRQPLPLMAAAAIALLLLAAAVRVIRKCRGAMLAARAEARYRHMKRYFRAINAGQWIAAIIAVFVLRRLRLDEWIVPAIMLIVGLHMLPLARLFGYSPHYLTGAALILTALLYPLANPNGPASASGCLVAAAILWLSAAWSLRQPEALRNGEELSHRGSG
jgi:MFS family permease